MPQIRTRTRIAFATMLTLGVISATACSSQQSSTSGDAATEPLTVGIATKFFQIAYEQGQDSEQAVTFSLFDGAGPAYEALSAKSIDVAFGADISTITSQSNGADLTIIGVAKPNPDWLRLIVPEGSSASSLTDLVGKKIAVVKGSAAHRFIVGEIEASGLTLSDFDLQFLSTADAQAAFLSGSVDAWAAWEPNAAQAELDHGAVLVQTATAATAGNIYVAVNSTLLDDSAKSDAVGNFYKSFVSELNATKADLDAWGRTLSSELSLSEDVALQFAENYTFTFTPIDDSSEADYEATAKVLEEQGIITSIPDAAEAFDDRFNSAVETANAG